MKAEDDKILERIKAHPGLRERFDAILDIAENKSGELITADQAEGKAIGGNRKIGPRIIKRMGFETPGKSD